MISTLRHLRQAHLTELSHKQAALSQIQQFRDYLNDREQALEAWDESLKDRETSLQEKTQEME